MQHLSDRGLDVKGFLLLTVDPCAGNGSPGTEETRSRRSHLSQRSEMSKRYDVDVMCASQTGSYMSSRSCKPLKCAPPSRATAHIQGDRSQRVLIEAIGENRREVLQRDTKQKEAYQRTKVCRSVYKWR